MSNLLKKLLYKDQNPVLILNVPEEYFPVLKEFSSQIDLEVNGKYSFIQVFAKDMKEEILLFLLSTLFILNGYSKLSADAKNLNWSSNQGFTSWNKARSKCAKINMRLPTIEELKTAHKAGVTESWKKNGNGYWSSTTSGDSTSYSFDISHGTAQADERRFSLFVRCVK